MTFRQLSLTINDGIARLTFTDAARGNPIDGRLCDELSEAAIQVSEDSQVRAMLIAAEGKAFSYGGDVKAFVGDFDGLPANIKRWTTTIHSAVARFQRMDAPVVAAVHGVCAGGMVAFAAGADLLIAADDARFVAAFPGIAYSCDSGSTIMITRRLGAARARRFFLLNETLDANAALAVGLADEVVSRDDLLTRAGALAAQFAQGPTRAYGEMRRLFLSAGDPPLETQLELEAQALARCSGTADAREGLTAFVERRQARFTGA